ncbi:MAG: hypothetical protein GC159_20030 [Phycisphaera sp.]|nr:hypothetical protein [Phycisphaera sp.]
MALTTQPRQDRSAPTPRRRRLVDPHSLAFYRLPEELHGLSILFVSDLHVRRLSHRHDAFFAELNGLEFDLLVLGGDYMDVPGDEPIAHELVTRLVREARPRHGVVGVWGNHDSPDMRHRLRHLPVRWLENGAWALEDLPLTVYGLDVTYDDVLVPSGDLLAAILDEPDATATRPGADAPAPPRFRLLVSHVPSWMPIAGDLGVDLMLSGHTHGGQVRLPFGGPLVNCLPGWPLQWSSGLLQSRRTLGLVTRGFGENTVQGLRLFCPPHTPLITLENADTERDPVDGVTCYMHW